METNREELKKKAMEAASVEEIMEIVRSAGEEITEEEAKQLFEKAQGRKEDKALSLDELESVSGGSDRDWAKDGCAATVEYGSLCGSDDYCNIWDVTYDHPPLGSKCPNCGTSLYRSYEIDYPYMREVAYKRCKNCGYKEFDYR